MRVGLTYDLRSEYLAEGYSEEETAEFDREETVAAIEEAIRAHGHEVERIGRITNLVKCLAEGRRWDLVFNIAEGLHGLAREAQIPALLEAYRIPYTFADPRALIISLDKALAKTLVRDAGLPTPAFKVVRTLADAEHIHLPFPLFAKPLAEGTGKGISAQSRVQTPRELEAVCARLLSQFRQPVLVERFLPGREFTVALLGTGASARVLGTLEVCLKAEAEAHAYSYVNKERCEELVDYRFPSGENDPVVAEAERIALEAWRILDGRDAGRVDLRCDEMGRPHFLEINPLAGLHPTHSDLPMIATAVGMTYHELIGAILESAVRRADTLCHAQISPRSPHS